LLRPDRVEIAFAPLALRRAVLLAVSGGPDSTALLFLAAGQAKRAGRPLLFAATVDHGLRPESADEAALVGGLAAKLGVAHATLKWEGVKPATRLQERAREARYALLIAHAKAIGAEALVTAHHLDDQAETVLMRLARGSGVAGLAGIPAESEREGVKILRPLLDVTKAELIAVCEDAGLGYISDPSNENVRFARVRLRKILAGEGLNASTLARLARRAEQVEAALVSQTAAAEARLGLIATGACEASLLLAEPTEIVQRLLTAAIARVGERDASRVGLEKIEALAAGLREAWDAGKRFSANVAGARVRCDSKGSVNVEPEPARRKSAEV
jgi:tRNA(Ile)-lysidine synthase